MVVVWFFVLEIKMLYLIGFMVMKMKKIIGIVGNVKGKKYCYCF